MTTTAQRQNIISLIEESWKNGARRHVALLPPQPAAQLAPPPKPTPEYTTNIAELVSADHRQASLRRSVTPHNKLTPEERSAVLAVINSEEFKDLPPSQIVPRLADQGIYLASESTMHRLLRTQHQNTHRRSERPAQKRHKSFELKATLINQVYT